MTEAKRKENENTIDFLERFAYAPLGIREVTRQFLGILSVQISLQVMFHALTPDEGTGLKRRIIGIISPDQSK